MPTNKEHSNLNYSKTPITASASNLDSQNSTTKPYRCSKKRLAVIIALCLALILLSTLLYYSFKSNKKPFVTTPDQPLRPTTYKYFGTKTSYSDALDLLRNSQFYKHLQGDNSRSSIKLKDLHEKLLQQNCKPLHFYLIMRHASRYPNKNTINLINTRIPEIIANINPVKQNQNAVNFNSSAPSFRSWKSPFKIQHDDLLTLSGFKEAEFIANQYKLLYPQFFNKSITDDIQFNVTGELRTSQTASIFARQVSNSDYEKYCNFSYDSNPHNHVSCYDQFQKDDALSFHKTCREKAVNPVENLDLVKSSAQVLKSMIESISSKLDLKKDKYLNVDDVFTIYELCTYEFGLAKSSLWCDLFDDSQLKYLEYIADVDDFYAAYGKHKATIYGNLVKSSCAILDGIHENLIGRRKNRARLLFTHSEVIQRIVARLIDFSDDDSYSFNKIRQSLSDNNINENRKWRTSVISPFASNIAFIKYKCNDDDQKIITSVQQYPLKVASCKTNQIDCDYDSIHGRLQAEQCDLDDLCRTKIDVILRDKN